MAKLKVIASSAAISLLVLIYIFLFVSLDVNHHFTRLPFPVVDKKHFMIDQPGCKIRKFDPMHESVRFMIKALSDVNCIQRPPPLFVSGSNARIPSIRLNTDAISKYGTNISCYYRVLSRSTEYESLIKELRVPIVSNILNISNEFIRIDCVNEKNKNVYFNYFGFIQRKPEVEKRSKHLKQIDLNSNKQGAERLNVLLLGIDSMSRNQFLRHMKKTYKYIKKNMNFVELFGYNKIGRNTYPNIIALTTGHLEAELPDTSKIYSDSLPMIWKEYVRAGYKTLFSEDFPTLTAFNFNRKGFRKQPTDYYFRTFGIALEAAPGKSRSGCYKDRVENSIILNYTFDFYDLFPKDPLFSFTFLKRLTHDDLNGLGRLDVPVKHFLQRLHENHHLNKTIVFLFGDHGFRFGKFRSTFIGRSEDKLPFHVIILPSWMEKKYPKLYSNLNTNSFRLTTPLDINASLRSILHLKEPPIQMVSRSRNISLFDRVVSGNRTCEEAAIAPEFCSCMQLQQVESSQETVKEAAEKLVGAINEIVRHFKKLCVEYKLDSVREAAVEVGGSVEERKFDPYYRITVKVSPSGGLFEGIVQYSAKEKSYAVLSEIDRIDYYGNQSHCINVVTLKPFCYCK